PGDVVMDPFMGSGTTILAAKELHRKSIGIDINTEYFNMVQGRLQQSQMLLFELEHRSGQQAKEIRS
ncbi:MAG TPA: DNA methyltransferase, partial [Candidatus Cloacimonadota bacterium]|nr:DNA methyltransferase [Candidatus Cloacimonadota bacterium]